MRRLRKITLILIMTIATIMVASTFSASYAATGSRYLTIKSLRSSGYGYKALEKNIWKICESNSSGTTVNYDHTIYCLKGGPGFGSSTFGSGTPSVRHYTRYFDMKNPSSITGDYANAIPSTSSNTYKSLLWLLENIYVAPKSNATDTERDTTAEYRELLLEKAGIAGGYITDDDIDAVQQLAVWHFTNDDEYKVENSSAGTFEFWVNAVANSDANYNPLSDEIGAGAENGWDRAEECQALYDYLISTAESMASSYTVTTASQPYELANTTITQTTSDSNYIIGPFKINQISNTSGTLTGTFKNGNTEITPTMQDKDGNSFATLQDTVGKEFYIVLPTSTTIETISLTISGSYFDTTITYWSVEGAPTDDQPVVEVERTKETYTDTVTFTPSEPEKEFDLALRKFITSINGEAPTVSREPEISRDTLQDLADGTIDTAIKTHTKTPLEVEKGDKVIYTIRVYNEGEIDGIVTEITDYLPSGLKLAENSTINTSNGWTNPSGDEKTIVTDKLAGTVIPAFNKETLNLSCLDVQVECEVTAEAPTDGKTTLKNIAEITGDNGGDDRDSTPDNVNKDNYGTTNQEDDDDFEDLVVIGKRFDLALRKFITSINGEEPTVSREPKISNQTLQDLADKKITTGVKTHTKTPLEVEKGDKVIYTIRVYNEGEIDGYVTEITDYLPDGLKLAENSTINTNNGWTNPSGDGITIVTDKLAGTAIPAFNKETLKLSYLDVQVECEVTADAPENGKTTLKNIAEITGDNGGDDIDSTPKDLTDEQKQNYNPGTSEQGIGYQDDDDFEDLVLVGKRFDLALRKFITAINGEAPTVSREPQITSATLQDLADGTIDTAIKTHPKNALTVETGDIVTYTIRVYNEGEIDGYVTEVTDYLPAGLKLAENSTINTNNGWTNPSGDGKTIVTDKLAGTILKAFDGTNLQYLDVQIECEVVATVQTTDNVLKNIAEITADKGGDDDDSTPNNVDKEYYGTTNQEDDDDFEQLIIPGKYFDLSLRKFITAVGDEKLVDENGTYTREPKVSVTPLLNGEKTASYEHDKKPVNVDVGDIVTYTIRVYNEGEIDGYVHQITDHLPPYLEFLNNEFNAGYGWKVSSDGRTVTTDITSPNTEYSASRDTLYVNRTEEEDKVLLKAFNTTSKELDYIDIQIQCKVKDTGIAEKITNIAEITKQTDSNGNEVTDRDSTPSNVTLPTDETLPEYKDDEIDRGDTYIPGQEDDDDFEKVIVQKFDLSLRKFITGVNEQEITGRVPTFSMDSEGNMTYTHPKTPVEVVNGDTIIYTLRIYNEGNQAGYADEVKDNIPEGLVYLPDNELNKTYRWKMYKEDGTETTNVEEAKTIRTDYLSKAQGDATGRDNLLDAFDKGTMTQPDYRDVKVAFKVTEPNTSDRILINIAEISEDADEKGNPVDDIDSTPDNDKDGEDDTDIEKVKVEYFDLALEKIISEYSITLNGKTTVTKTGHKFGVQPEPVVKVETLKKTRKNATIKFKYQIQVTNEGEIAGYATEIKDYIPTGLKFVQADNPKWKLSSDGKTVTTDQLKDKLLQPGESAVVEITFQWINGENNLGLKQNWAEISKDKNDSDSPDIDSTPDNNKQGEDDIDDASVILSVVTGIGENYILIGGAVLAIIAGGLVLIKKFVI